MATFRLTSRGEVSVDLSGRARTVNNLQHARRALDAAVAAWASKAVEQVSADDRLDFLRAHDGVWPS